MELSRGSSDPRKLGQTQAAWRAAAESLPAIQKATRTLADREALPPPELAMAPR